MIRFEDIEATINWVEIPVKIGGQTTEGKIFVDENSSWRWVGNDLVIAYSNTTIKGGLRFFDPEHPELPPVWANARILAVGGGGGGGMIGSRGSGGGAGGGAGGFVERDGLVFDNQVEYQVTVGAGGMGGKAHEETGKNGKDSLITTNGAVVIDAALGGGGGGAHSPGEAGGSGGGGSRSTESTNYDKPGGAGVDGQGYSGGQGNAAYRGGGGGGAGGPGNDATAISTQGSNGGPGRESDITGSSVMYAGGGGSAYVNTINAGIAKYPGGTGGVGGGGNGAGVDGGASGTELNPIPATNGADGLGGGGGGGVSHDNADETAGNGGNGVVIIRLSGFVVSNIPVPGTKVGGRYVGPTYTFDGNAKTGVVEFFAYKIKTDGPITTQPIAVNADNYAVTVSIDASAPYGWGDVPATDPTYRGERVIHWTINQMPVTVPNVTPTYVYDSNVHYAVDPTRYAIDANGYCHLTHAGLDHAYCKVEGNAQTEANPLGESYTVTISLSRLDFDGNAATNYIWNLPRTMADQQIHWTITQAPNSIRELDYPCRNLARLAPPLDAFKCDWPKRARMDIGNNVIVEYRPVDDEEGWVDWGPATSGGPKTKGSYIIRVTIPETYNWQGDSAEMEFGTWEKPADLFSDQQKFTLSGFTGSTSLTDFPVPVIIREPERDGYSERSGFQYMRAGADGHDIQFFSSAGDPIPHEVERWNTRGESLVWVKVPSANKSATITMCWKRCSDIYLRPYDGGAVWRDQYEGVWHMSEIRNKRIPDATDNGHDAYFTGDASWERLEEKDGARVMGAIRLNRGDILVENNIFPSGTTSNSMTFTGWYTYPDFVADGKAAALGSGYKVFAGLKYDVTTTADAKAWPGWALRMNNAANRVMLEATNTEFERNGIGWSMNTGWGLLGAVFGSGTAAPGTGAKLLYGQTTISSTANATAPYFMNGADKPLQLATGGFCVDEVRLSKKVLADAWNQEAAYTVTKARSYCVPATGSEGLVRIDCDRYNDGKGLICDWWKTKPELKPTIWRKGEKGTLSVGAYQSGASVGVEYVNRTNGVSYGSTQPTEIGFYTVTLDHQLSTRAQYRPQSYAIDFYIIERQDPSHDLGGSEGGRVLIMNADNIADAPVTNQGWCAQSDAGVTYWRILGGGAGTNNIMPGTEFELVRSADTNRLWYLKHCRQGNTFPTNDLQGLNSNYCFLPSGASSETALAITNENAKAARGSSGWLMLRNTTDAEVYSPCYTNGIGTIYFDAVNHKRSVKSGTNVNADGYKLVLEIATETDAGLPPTDENSWTEPAPGTTNRYGRLEGMWQPVVMYPSHFAGTVSPTDESETNELALMEITGASMTRYYRVHAPVNLHTPVRFRIRRTSVDPTCVDAEGNQLLDEGFILMDNVIASVPTVYAAMEPYGRLDPELPGDRAVGVGGAFNVPFPSVADATNLFGRARVLLPPGSAYAGKNPGEFISLAQMFYRRRYLNSVGAWSVATMSGTEPGRMDASAALGLPALEGDVEFYFVSVMKAPYYGYVDYTGLKWPVDKNGYSEAVEKWESHLDGQVIARTQAGRLASGGTDWFTRIRGVEKGSDFEQASVVLEGAIEGEFPMQVTADGKWRAMVIIPPDAETGVCTFRFRGRNKQVPGETVVASNETFWGGGDMKEAELPANGVLTVGGNATPFQLDHVSNYLEFKARLDGDEPIWSVTRAEYQNFNNWNDVWSSPMDQTFTVATNGVDDVAMKTANLDTGSWALYQSENDNWNETFYLVNFNDPGFPKEQFFPRHATPNTWNGENLTFVSKNLAAYKGPTEKDNVSGMAAKLRGQGAGVLEYAKSTGPKGIERVDFTARIGQSLTFDDVRYWERAIFPHKSDYTFIAPVSMSRAVPKDAEAGDMAVGAAVSVFAYYREGVGAYEFRVTRAASGTEVMLELFKWKLINGSMGWERLCGQRYNSTGNDSLKPWSNAGEAAPDYFALFISVQNNTGGGTKIIGGLAHTSKTDLASPFTGADVGGYGGLVYTDKSSPFTYGAYGVGAKDCPARFMSPRHYDAPVTSSITGLGNTGTYAGGQWYKPSGGKAIAFAGDVVDDSADVRDGYLAEKGPLEKCVQRGGVGAADLYGLQTPVDLTQRVVLQLRPRGSGSAWTDVGSREVGGYALQSFQVPLYLSGDFDLRVTTGSDKAVDVVVGEVRQLQWQGTDHERAASGSSDMFIYTQGCVLSNLVRRSKGVVLQPARGLPTKPVSVRSPLLNGLGKVSFFYEDADPAAEIWVQVATNHVENNLYGAGGYNQSIESTDDPAEQVVPKWLTVAKYGASMDCSEPLGDHGVKTVYLGWHGSKDPEDVNAVFRLFVPPHVVEKATVLATNATHQVDYGRITVSGMTVTDEPAISENSWRGWNLRTVGEPTDAEGRMYLADGLLANDVGYGLACALNNAVTGLKPGSDELQAATRNPAIWSPTVQPAGGKRRAIGSVAFRARLYYANDQRETDAGGKVTVWGSPTDSVSENWTKVAEFDITSSEFTNCTWAANGVSLRAVKLEISDPAARTPHAATDRVVLDEVVVCEKVQPSVAFVYARPFRTDLFEPVEIADIMSMNQQPLAGESWGVQAKLSLSTMEEEVSGVEVYLTYYVGKSPWGYDKWKDRGSTPVKLTPVGEEGSFVFRSVATGPDTIVPPTVAAGSVVQYMLIVRYSNETGASEERPMDNWTQPEWFWPIDLNRDNGGYEDPAKFSAYTILDSVSPGRAWINEVNWNDGPAEETGGTRSVTNQFIEICVPSGVDMTGWYLRATDFNLKQWTMAAFGDQVPARKISPYATNGFEFVVLESPETNYRGGIRAPDGTLAADGTWASDGPGGTAPSGTLNYSQPFAFELVRPSGVVEHQVVLQGTNEWADLPRTAARYYGTNLLARLNAADGSPKRFYAAEETSKRRDGLTVGSAGVQGGNADGDPAPGADGTWANRMRFTAGRLNEGQIIPEGWFLAPSGTNAWLYLSVDGDHISQKIGGDTNRQTMVIVPQGVATNIVYTADPWFETATLTLKDDSGTRTVPWHRRGASTYSIAATGLTYVTAHEGLDSGLDRFNVGFAPGKSAYSRAVVNWLRENWPDATPDDIRLAHYMNLVNESVVTNLSLTEMYWFDIPPVNSEGHESDESEWWLRAGFTGIRPQQYRRKGFNGVVYTNSQFDVKMYVSNDWTHVAHAPERLQGLANERSDESSTYSGGWTSVTFKIRGMLINGEPGNRGYLPFRMFTFGPGSFSGAADDPPFTSTIEIQDPFSTSSPGYSYGWGSYPNTTPFWFKWAIDTDGVPDTVETLKKEDVYHDVE